eukprot:TRINITY_DN3142_c0_g1_i1.p1 TRINITY_DN3142_c0_g1~~TRINITY_DN3142_c0_g1_i1.p1  ORF type:complete len:993 (-),score=159.45 TRINITY_DN3142_c0_g1_i1:1331-4309(-)
MDIDTTPATPYRDGTSAMHLQVPSPTEHVNMEVDQDVARAMDTSNTTCNPSQLSSIFTSNSFLAAPTPTGNLPSLVDSTAPNLRPIPTPPVVLLHASDVLVWPRFKVDELFNEWLEQPDSKPWLQKLLDDVRTGNVTASAEMEIAQRLAKHDKSLSPSHARSPSSAPQSAAGTAPQQAPSSPISRLFRSHIPFGDTDSSPRSPVAASASIAAHLRSTMQAPVSADLDLGKSGTVSPLPLDQRVSPILFSLPAKTPEKAVRAEPAKDVQMEVIDVPAVPDAEVKIDEAPRPEKEPVDSETDGIAEITAAVDKVSSHDATPTDAERKRGDKSESELSAVSTLESAKKVAEGRKPVIDDTVSVAEKEIVKTSDAVPLKEAIATDTAIADRVGKASSVHVTSDTVRMESESETVKLKSEEPRISDIPKLSEEKVVFAAIPPSKPKPSRKEDATMTDAPTGVCKGTALPRFYYPCGKDAEDRERKEHELMKKFFKRMREEKKQPGATRSDLGELVLDVVGLPTYFAGIVFDAVMRLGCQKKADHVDSAVTTANQTNETDMKDVDSRQSTEVRSNITDGIVQQSPRSDGGTKSDTTMGDAVDGDEVSNETRQLNGFHSVSRANEASTGISATADSVTNAESVNAVIRDYITEEQFSAFYGTICVSHPKEERLFSVLCEPGADRDYLIPSDFKPLLHALLMCHQGLAFLQATPEFQQRYSETVIERIYFGCTRQHNGRLTLQDIRRSRLLETLLVVDEEEDINRERKFFSYEHFYVLYCRFWELDANHDLQIDREDLMRYGSHSLTSRIVDRIFGGYARPLDSPENPGFMSYTDFIWFCLSEEDKTSDTAIDYWFRCIDMDGDGLITMYDMEFFYKEQLHRMECFGHEPVQIKDILCQLLDMIKPSVQPPVIRRKDLKRCRLAGNFFNVLFNLNKFFAIEARDPLQIRQEHATPELTDWDRFAALEYLRLSAEEEEAEEESWEDVGDCANPLMAGEAPF